MITSSGTNLWSTSQAKPHSDYIHWCYAVDLVSPQMKCYSCTQPKSDRYWNMLSLSLAHSLSLSLPLSPLSLYICICIYTYVYINTHIYHNTTTCDFMLSTIIRPVCGKRFMGPHGSDCLITIGGDGVHSVIIARGQHPYWALFSKLLAHPIIDTLMVSCHKGPTRHAYIYIFLLFP